MASAGGPASTCTIRKNAATLDKVYLFDRQDTGLCAVWVAQLADLQRFLAPVPLRDRP